MIEEYRNGNIRVWVAAVVDQDAIEIRAVRYLNKQDGQVGTEYLSPDDLTWHECWPLAIIPSLLTLSGLDLTTRSDHVESRVKEVADMLREHLPNRRGGG